MIGYSWSKSDFRELLYAKYYTMEEINGCLGSGKQDTDYVLCNGESDLLPTLYKKDEIRYEYNQGNQSWSKVSCTIFAAIGMLSDLINYEFSLSEIKEVDELSYERGRIRGQGWYVQSAVKLVADRYNNSELSKKYGKVAYYRISKYDNEIIEDVIDKLYTIDGNHGLNSDYSKDKLDGMVDGTDFGKITSGHSVDVIKNSGQRAVKNSYKGTKNNIYGLKNKLSQITNFGEYFYVYTLVKEDNLEEIKRLNEIKSECNTLIEHLGTLWHLVNDTNFQGVLHYTAEKLRGKINDCNEQLKKYI